MDDERFKDIIKDPKFKKIPNAAKKTKIDKRFQVMFTDEKFKIKGTKDKRGRDIKISSKEDLKRFYQLTDSDNNDSEKDVKMKKKINQAYKPLPLEPQKFSSDNKSDGDTTDTYTDEDETEEIDHKWGELDADCPDIAEATARLAVCNMSWDLITAEDLFTLFDSLKPSGGIIENVKIYQSEYGKKMKALEDTRGPFSLIKGLCPSKNIESDGENEVEENDDEDNFDIEKLRQYQINTMKYAYAIVKCDCAQTAEHIYNQGNGLEFEKTSNLLDLRFVPDDTSFEDCEDSILSVCDVEQALLSSGLAGKTKNVIEPTNGNVFGNAKCLTQTRFDLTWDQTDPKRKKALEDDLAILYQTDPSKIDKVSKSKASKLKRQMRKRMIDSLVTDEKLGLNNLLAPPSSSSDEENSSSHTAAPGKPVHKADADGKNKMATYREMLADVLCDKESDIVPECSASSESEKENGDTEITWEPELQDVTKGMVEQKLKKAREEKLGPWEKYLEKDKRKRADKKRSKQKTNEVPSSGQDGNSSDLEENTRNTHDEDLELLVMSAGENSSDDSDHNVQPKKIKGKQKRKMSVVKNEISTHKSSFEFDEKDSRFKALLTDPRYGLDPSNPNFKMSKNIQKILERKTKQNNVTS